MGLGLLLIVVVAVVLLAGGGKNIMRWFDDQNSQVGGVSRDARQILDTRLARGEINSEEYNALREQLER